MTPFATDLTVYIPIDRRMALASQQALPERTQGTVLVADVSGFTPLTASLIKVLGRQQGVEELTRRLNQVYTALIEQIHQFHGTVVNFNGDAITCWFDQDNGRRALTCALALQQAMDCFNQAKTSDGVAPLGIKIGVTAGPVRRFIVGDPAFQQLDVLAGAVVSRAVAITRLADIGEVVAGAEVAFILSEELALMEWRTEPAAGLPVVVVAALYQMATPDPWAQNNSGLPLLPDEVVRPWLLPAVYQRLRHGQAIFLAELRLATCLFLKAAALDYEGDPTAPDQLDSYVQWLQKIAAAYGGALIDLNVAADGTQFYFSFGAPITQDDDPARALAAALALQKAPPALVMGHSVQVALTSGQMRAGAYGSASRRAYGVLGNAANLASRLLELTPSGQIWCDQEIWQALHKRQQFVPLAPVALKGFAESVAIYQATGVEAAPAATEENGKRQSLIGRQTELRRLASLLTAVQQGNSQIVFLEGEAGIGKSRLVEAFLTRLHQQGLKELAGSGQSVARYTPYRAWREIVSGLLAIKQTPVVANLIVQAQVEKLVPDQLIRLPLLYQLLDLPPAGGLSPAGDKPHLLDPALQQENLSIVLLALLQQWAAEQPLILIIDDAHWLDSLSWELIVQVTRGLKAAPIPFLILLASRPVNAQHLTCQKIDLLRRLAPVETISLAPLATAEMVALVESNLGVAGASLPAPLVELLVQRAGGNPFFAEEMVMALQEQAMIRLEATDDGRRCLVIGDFYQARQTLPDTLRGLILARIDRLPPDEQLTLKVASVIGHTFTAELLFHTLNQYRSLSRKTVRQYLAALVEQGLVRPEAQALSAQYAFKQLLTQEVAYQTLLFAQRRHLHRLVAEYYEQLWHLPAASAPFDPVSLAQVRAAGEISGARFSRLAYHYRQAGEVERQRRYARLAGEQAAGQQAHAEAVDHFSQALLLTPPHAWLERYELLLARQQAHNQLGERAAQLADLTALQDLAMALGDKERLAQVMLGRARCAELTADYTAAVTATQMAISLAAESHSLALTAEGYYEWGLALVRQSQYQAGHIRLQMALAYARSAAALPVEAGALRALGVSLAYQGDYRGAEEYYEEALTLFRRIGDRSGESRVVSNLGTSARYQHQYQIARRYYQQALAISREIGDRNWEAASLLNIGFFYKELGQYETAQAHFEASLRLHAETGDRMGQGLSYNALATLQYLQGDCNTALAYSLQSLQIAEEIAAPQDIAEAKHNMADILLAMGRAAEAAANYQQAFALRQKLGQKVAAIESQAGLALACLQQGHKRKAQTQAEAVLHFLDHDWLDGAEEPLAIYWRCYQVLQANGDWRAGRLLATAQQKLRALLAELPDEASRQSCRENVPHYRALLALATAVTRPALKV
jgi:adenylate cyclase